jgi:hypothetical protein
MRLKRMAVGVIALGGVLVACSASETDFKEAAEKDLREAVEEVIDGDTEVECEEPESTDEGAQFDCTGTDGEGTEFTGIGTIIGEKSYRVDILHPRGEEIVAAMND